MKPSSGALALAFVLSLPPLGMAALFGSPWPRTVGAALFLGVVAVGLLYVTNRSSWHRAAGFHGPDAEAQQWSGSNVGARGKWAAAGSAFGGLFLASVVFATGWPEQRVVAVLSAAIAGIMLGAVGLWLVLLARARSAGDT
jgi:hypothetical protein